jgi:hypothetical protein
MKEPNHKNQDTGLGALNPGRQNFLKVGGSGFAPLEVNSPMARWKLPQSAEWVNGAHSRFNFPNWQSGNDDSVYYNLNILVDPMSRTECPGV